MRWSQSSAPHSVLKIASHGETQFRTATQTVNNRRPDRRRERKIFDEAQNRKEAAELYPHAGDSTRNDVEYEYDSLCYADFYENIDGKDNYP